MTDPKNSSGIATLRPIIFALIVLGFCAIVIIVVSFILPDSVNVPADVPSPSILGKYRYAATASDVQECATAATNIMAKGGNAIDAAITGMLCINLFNPHSSGIGGGHFLVYYDAKSQKSYSIDAREKAPSTAFKEMFVNKPNASEYGPLAIGVPGEVLGMWVAHQKFGHLPWKSLFDPVIRLAEVGVPVRKPVADAIPKTLRRLEYFSPMHQAFTELRDFLINGQTGQPFKAGEKMQFLKLAETLRVIAEEGGLTFYNGTLSEKIMKDLAYADSPITAKDLNDYSVVATDALTYHFGEGETLHSVAPPSSGAILSYILNILDPYNFSPSDIGNLEKTGLTYHRIVEAMKFGYAKRFYLGDPEFIIGMKDLVDECTNSTFGEETRRKIDDTRTFDPSYYGLYSDNRTRPGTSHLSVIDSHGNAVAVTTTINLHFGSLIMGRSTGIIFNDEMDDFSSPDHPNYFDLPPAPNNFPEGGKRPVSSMSPVIGTDREGRVMTVLGASGGSYITSAVAWVMAHSTWFGKNVKEAIDSHRLHDQVIPEVTYYEPGMSTDLLAQLKRRGQVNLTTWSGGVAESVVQGIVVATNGTIYANADFRKDGGVDGF